MSLVHAGAEHHAESVQRRQAASDAERERKLSQHADDRRPLLQAISAALPSALVEYVKHDPELPVRRLASVTDGYEYNPVIIDLPGCIPIRAYWYGKQAYYFPAEPAVVWDDIAEAWQVGNVSGYLARPERDFRYDEPDGHRTQDLNIAIYIAHRRTRSLLGLQSEADERNGVRPEPKAPPVNPVDKWLEAGEKYAQSISGADWVTASALMALAYIVRNND